MINKLSINYSAIPLLDILIITYISSELTGKYVIYDIFNLYISELLNRFISYKWKNEKKINLDVVKHCINTEPVVD